MRASFLKCIPGTEGGRRNSSSSYRGLENGVQQGLSEVEGKGQVCRGE